MTSKSTDDIWVFSATNVDNKSILMRIAHSPRLHATRSAFNFKQPLGSLGSKEPLDSKRSFGSLGSKALTVAGIVGRVGLKLIPIPVFGSLLSSVEADVEGRIRTHYHQKKGPETQADNVKFSLKEISVANLDRFRFKVTDSVDQMKRIGDAYPGKYTIAQKNYSPCDADLELALAIAQAERRLEKFETEVAGLMVILTASTEWAIAVRNSVTDYKNNTSKEFAKNAQAELNMTTTFAEKVYTVHTVDDTALSGHVKCGKFCMHHKINKINSSKDSRRAYLAALVRALQQPFSAESILELNANSFKVGTPWNDYKP